jgi:uncharacterized protein YjfI (DUF2170 family)
VHKSLRYNSIIRNKTMAKRDYYEVLGALTKNASEDDIKKSI